ncbi:MAG TPA: adenosine deaminase [Thermomicrobiales bacterium]|jgi:adenosine deaminase|nr:adenosine deaminase [Thermomicrobiales bacterium]HQZ90854.1 adenosine deaminase [Thermomicrobiales bacterium]HRA32205.1 adenosine deaminase [Thermomicrobiales bacterium]
MRETPTRLTGAERAFLARMPKPELHVHLEGSVRPETLLDLGRRHGVVYPFDDTNGARDWYRFRDFPHFIEVFMAVCDSLQTSEDYERVTWELAETARAENIPYLEVTISPTSPLKPRTKAMPDLVLAGCRAGARQGWDDFGVRIQFIVDAVRVRAPDEVTAIAEWCVANLGDGLVGIGLGGTEIGYPAAPHAAAIEFARRNGARVSLHAGETVGPESVWDALESGAERIGHGVTSIHDPELVRRLAANRVVLEVSPTSNIRLGVASSYATHPIRALHDAGVPVTVNTDDPPMFDATMTGEYVALAEEAGFDIDELSAMARRAAEAAFLPDSERAELVARIDREVATLREDLASDCPG